ncbi:dynein regulatory complex subunit 3 [Rhineura floridana]|uniref:dynein regulatory complex subunit 3 n=1 Tax=Rhineura floridana TaxID=261503 RepID=UPI002AC87BF9|nr:dynein regulatory complex subunit 3 [Rhineura floridana]XP_061456388.1 dynein regulatory complex subunit 3 [Rhineura floridana]XP_061456389.1 dynein regulatory complex subunit 3 [Rhineura floridana]XP_061456390.1 dynein regulatory complex subunit 3 [Rhineura floridana]XP_061456391.1 dynein regulatory complex subunit 3 [Rhineura floridana]
MSRLYDSTEPNVIDEDMLQKAVEEQGPQEEVGQLAKKEGINFKDVKELQLDFRNILKIDNLWQFVNLTKLQLDNNIIERIEALDSLVHLVWLDLSFNNIEVIEGLDTLVKLQDLSLYNNRISKIENLDMLQELQVFSVGNNNIQTLENIIYLRKFKSLRTLNLTGNPVCENELYSMFIAAYLPDLVYLDFRLVDDNTREMALIKYQYAIEEMKQGEAVALVKQQALEASEKEVEYHKSAYVEYLNGPFLFDSMYAEDPEAAKLVYLPGVPELLEIYKSKFVDICESLFEYGLRQHEKREAEVALFYECLNEALQDSQEQGTKIMQDFEEKNHRAIDVIQSLSDTQVAERKLTEYNEDITKLSETLMTLEMQLVDQLEEVIKDFERNIADLVSTFIENEQGMMAQCRDLENHHHEKLLEIAISTLEKIVKSEFDEEMPDDVRMLFVDKDTIVNAVNASHDIHLLKIDNREDEIITKANGWASTLIEKVHKNEIQRNRSRVMEINQYIDHLRSELDNFDILEI